MNSKNWKISGTSDTCALRKTRTVSHWHGPSDPMMYEGYETRETVVECLHPANKSENCSKKCCPIRAVENVVGR